MASLRPLLSRLLQLRWILGRPPLLSAVLPSLLRRVQRRVPWGVLRSIQSVLSVFAILPSVSARRFDAVLFVLGRLASGHHDHPGPAGLTGPVWGLREEGIARSAADFAVASFFRKIGSAARGSGISVPGPLLRRPFVLRDADRARWVVPGPVAGANPTQVSPDDRTLQYLGGVFVAFLHQSRNDRDRLQMQTACGKPIGLLVDFADTLLR